MKYLSLILLFSLSAMTHQEKVGQVFIGLYDQETISESKLGNVIYFTWANDLSSPEQVKTLSKEVQEVILKETGVPPFIAIDQEGGRVSRLSWLKVPSSRILATQNKTRETGEQVGAHLRELGINFNFAPVVDVDSNPDNPVIGDRSFGTTPEIVTFHAKEMIGGLHTSGALTTLKHFPGHGDTQADSHLGLAKVNKSRSELEKMELLPFFQLKDQTDAIMTAHVYYPALDPKKPATLSKPILTDLLRTEWNYKGLVISDSLTMRGISPNQATFEEAVASVSEAALEAFNAGCDMLIVGKLEWADMKTTPEQDRELICRVMENFSQKVDKERLDASVERILKAKEKI